MTHPILHKTVSLLQSKKAISRTKSNARQSTTQILALDSRLRRKSPCLMSPPLSQTRGSTPNGGVLLDPKPLNQLLVKGFLHTDLVPSLARPKSRRQIGPAAGDTRPLPAESHPNPDHCSPNLALSKGIRGGLMHCHGMQPAKGSPIQSDPERIPSPINGQSVDHRLLTKKLGGWAGGSPISGKRAEGPPHAGGVETSRHRISLHSAPRPLPLYLIKLVNQLMRHGKKGLSVGLLADSLALFCKRLEEGGRSNLYNSGARSGIQPKPGDGEGRRASNPAQVSKVGHRDGAQQGLATHASQSNARGGSKATLATHAQQGQRGGSKATLAPHAQQGGALQSNARGGMAPSPSGIPSQCVRSKGMEGWGVPSFPFHLRSFPGPTFSDAFSQSKSQLDRLLGLPFSGVLSPNFSSLRLSFLEKGGGHRGLLGVEPPQALQGQASLGSGVSLNGSGPKDVGLNGFVSLKGLDGMWQEPHNPCDPRAARPWSGLQPANGEKGLTRSPSPPRAGMGLNFYTKKPAYFWRLKGRALGGNPSLALHSDGMKAHGGLPARRPGLANGPQASVLSHLGRAISNVEPSLEVRKKKIAGITRQIPSVVPKARGERLAIRWIINSARERARKRGKGLGYCLAEELIDAYYKRGEPRQRRDYLHKAAESNRSFLRYRWW